MDLNNYSSLKTEITDILRKVTIVPQYQIDSLKLKPWWNNKFNEFQKYIEIKFPGTHVVAHPDQYASMSICMLNILMLSDDTTVLNKMENSACHDNCFILYHHDRSHRIFTGYALSDDGLWRYHSWIVTKNNAIIETTVNRLIYIGYDATNEYKENINVMKFMDNSS